MENQKDLAEEKKMTVEQDITSKDKLLIKLLKDRKINISINKSLVVSTQNEKLSNLNLTIDEIIIVMKINDENTRLKATQACRKILDVEDKLPIIEKIYKEIVPLCIEFLKPQYSSKLQCKACWIITAIASGTSEQVQYIIEQGAIPLLVELLKSPSLNVAEEAVWTLGNIAGDRPEACNLILKDGALPLLVQLITPKIPVSMLRIIVWTLSNLSASINSSNGSLLETINSLLSYSDKEVLSDICRAFSYLTNGPNENIQAVINCGALPKLIELLASSEVTVLKYALQTVCHIASGNDLQTDMIIAHGGLQFLRNLLYHNDVDIAKLAARTIGKITAGNVKQIQQVIDADIISLMLTVMNERDFESQKIAAWSVRNITCKGTVFQIAYLVQKKVLKPFCDLLMSKNCICVLLILESFYNILSTAQKINEVDRVTFMIKEVGGLDYLKALKQNENIQISQKAANLIDLYFS